MAIAKHFVRPILKLTHKISFLKRCLKNRGVIEGFLRFSDVNATGGTVDDLEFATLVDLAKEASLSRGPIIEIGTLFGYSTQALALGKGIDQELLTVDAFSWNPIGIPKWRHEELARKNLVFLIRTQNVRLIVASNEQFYADWDGRQPALVFIDACHTYEQVRIDIDWALKVKARIICGDDISWEGVKKAVEESFGTRYKVIGDMWIAEK